MIRALIENTYVQLLIVGLIVALIYFHLTRKRIKLNEPPLVNYRIPIIGHTLRFIDDCEKLVLESREKLEKIRFLKYTKKKMTLIFIQVLKCNYFFKVNLNDIIDQIQQNVVKGINIYIGECIEPMVINDPHKVVLNIFAMVAASIFFGEEYGHYEEILELFKNLVDSILKSFFAPKYYPLYIPGFMTNLQHFLYDLCQNINK
ncbi:cytochrome P450 [Gigaspora margarita]|uniref:Cytochrome P450 n=1 Tax=Gigaspora margarita TaxID=4874 RepID=A0A8H3WXM0_GIGMA|nr:cytochrome P450 [Gigaspora margarita]